MKERIFGKFSRFYSILTVLLGSSSATHDTGIPTTWIKTSLVDAVKLRVEKKVSLLGLLAKIKCSICSYQLNI